MPNGGTCGFFAGRVGFAYRRRGGSENAPYRPAGCGTPCWGRLPEGTDAETLLDAMLGASIGRPPGS